jgi:hypothetical protein
MAMVQDVAHEGRFHRVAHFVSSSDEAPQGPKGERPAPIARAGPSIR